MFVRTVAPSDTVEISVRPPSLEPVRVYVSMRFVTPLATWMVLDGVKSGASPPVGYS